VDEDAMSEDLMALREFHFSIKEEDLRQYKEVVVVRRVLNNLIRMLVSTPSKIPWSGCEIEAS
jgi:hypothetical protein